jgi:hypothetical protein
MEAEAELHGKTYVLVAASAFLNDPQFFITDND